VKVPAVPGLKLGGAVKWQSDTHNGSVMQKAYSVADLHASYQLTPQLEIGANLRNVGNTKALTSLLWPQAYYIAPRNGSVTLQWRH
jgi:outer membrane receptor for ferric coprogen and ferric-rhodotorulic acid